MPVGLLLRYQADLAAINRHQSRVSGLMLEALGAESPKLAEDLLPAQILLREIEGRWCDVSDQLHDVARRC